MDTSAAVLALFMLGLLTVFQLLLVFGAPLGRFAWGGQHRVLPRRLRVGSITSIILYAVFAAVIADRADLIDAMPDAVSGVGTWVLAAYFGLGIGMNAMSRSVPERATMTPVCAVLAAACVLVALGRS